MVVILDMGRSCDNYMKLVETLRMRSDMVLGGRLRLILDSREISRAFFDKSWLANQQSVGRTLVCGAEPCSWNVA